MLLQIANEEIKSADKIHAKGKLTDVERFQKIIDTWNLTSESLKDEVVSYFKNYDPLNSVYIMAFSGARGNLSQVKKMFGPNLSFCTGLQNGYGGPNNVKFLSWSWCHPSVPEKIEFGLSLPDPYITEIIKSQY